MKQRIRSIIEAVTSHGQRVHRPMTAFFTFIFLSTFIVIFIFAVKLTNDIFYKHVDIQLKQVESFYQEQIGSQIELQELILKGLLNDKEIITTVEQSTDFTKFNAIYTSLAAYKITHLYIFSPKRIVIHRAHSPERKGDEIRRTNLLQAERTKSAVTGLELGKIGAFTLRSATPVFKQNKLIGYIEVGMELGHIAERTELQFDVLLYEFFDRNVATQNRNMLQPLSDRRAERSLDSRYIINASPNASFNDQHIQNIINTAGMETAQTLLKSTAIKTTKMFDYSGDNVGFMAIVADISTLYDKRNQDLLMLGLISLLIGSMIFFITSRVFKYLEQAIKSYSYKQQRSEQELKQSIQQLKDTQQIIIEREKFASLGSLVAGIAHEVNTPLGISLTAGTAVLDESKKITKQINNKTLTQNTLVESVNKINDLSGLIDKNLHRASHLVQSFKQVAVDQSSEQPRKVQMSKLLLEIVTSLEPQLKKGKHSALVTCPDDLVITTIPGYWSQILFNLMNNSIIHGFEGQHSKTISITMTQDKNTVSLIYADNGLGLSTKSKSKIFEPFFTTKRNEGGSGLGMHLVFNIVTQALKGNIEILNTQDKGLSYKITSPS